MIRMQSFPNLEIIVQDSMSTISQIDSKSLDDLQGRAAFMEHSFFETQPICDAAAYFLRLVTHNWDDDNCIHIFKCLVPALERCKPGTPLLINDIVLPDWNSDKMSRFQEHRLRQIDIMMMGALGSKQRTKAEFSALLKRADARFRVSTSKIHNSSFLLTSNDFSDQQHTER